MMAALGAMLTYVAQTHHIFTCKHLPLTHKPMLQCITSTPTPHQQGMRVATCYEGPNCCHDAIWRPHLLNGGLGLGRQPPQWRYNQLQPASLFFMMCSLVSLKLEMPFMSAEVELVHPGRCWLALLSIDHMSMQDWIVKILQRAKMAAL